MNSISKHISKFFFFRRKGVVHVKKWRERERERERESSYETSVFDGVHEGLLIGMLVIEWEKVFFVLFIDQRRMNER